MHGFVVNLRGLQDSFLWLVPIDPSVGAAPCGNRALWHTQKQLPLSDCANAPTPPLANLLAYHGEDSSFAR